MKQNIFRVLALALAILMISSLISACGGDSGSAPDVTTNAVGAGTEAETEPVLSDDLPEADYNGYKFRVVTYQKCIGIEEEDGEVLNDAEYARDRIVEERFNVDVVADFKEVYTDVTKAVKNSVSAGSDDYDMGMIHMVEGAYNAPGGYYYPVNDLPYINLDKPWWDDQIQNGFSIANKLFLAAGDILPNTLLRTSCMAFSKNEFENRGIEAPYAVVQEGRWTLDRLSELTRDVTADLNGDGAVNFKDDFYGLTSWYLDSPYSFYYGAGGTIIEKDADDIPHINMNVDMNVDIYNKLYDVIIVNKSNFITKIDNYDYAYETFTGGRALFCEIALTHLRGERWRNMTADYGVVPIPKYDEEQETYLGFVNGSAPMVCVPVTINDADRTSIVIEALSFASYTEVTPVLYEVVAKTKHTRDEESVAMIDIIIRERIFDFGYTHLYANSITQFHRDLLAKGSTDVASALAAGEPSLRAALEKIILSYEENT